MTNEKNHSHRPLSKKRFIVSLYLCSAVPSILAMSACAYAATWEFLLSFVAPFASLFFMASAIFEGPFGLGNLMMAAYVVGVPALFLVGYRRRNQLKWQILCCVTAVLLSLPFAIYGIMNCV